MPGVLKWVFDDLAGVTYTVPINPNTMSKLKSARPVTIKATTAVNGQSLFFEGQRPPQQITFGGVLFDKAHYDALDHWVYATGRIQITDHYLRKLSCVLTDFDPSPKRSITQYWRHDYSISGICYNVDISGAIVVPP